MSLVFDVQGAAQPLQGSILRGKGFRVWGDWTSSEHGTLRFLFQQLYREMPLNEWSGGNSFPAAFEGSVGIDMPPSSNSASRVTLDYDLHNISLSISDRPACSRISPYGATI